MPNRTLREVLADKNELVSIQQSDTINNAVELMAECNIGAVLVYNKDTPVGIVTERDIIKKYLTSKKKLTFVHQIMSSTLVTVDVNKKFSHALYIMHENNFRHLPVVDSNHVIGMISARDALSMDLKELESMQQEYDAIAEIIA